jgi:hypothetical protein
MHKSRLKYYSSIITAVAASYCAAWGATVILGDADVPKWVNGALTIITKGGVFLTTHIAMYGLLHLNRYESIRDYLTDDGKMLTMSSIKAEVACNTAKFLVHTGAMYAGVGNGKAFWATYATIGFLGFLYKRHLDHNNNLVHTSATSAAQPQSLDNIVTGTNTPNAG